MEKNIEFLNYIYQNAEMGLVGIDNIKDSIEDIELKKVIAEQERDYQDICDKAISLLEDYNREEKDINAMAKVMTFIDAKIKTLEDNSASNIAKMMIEGNTKGIVEIEEKINNYNSCDKKVISLAKNLLRIEKRNNDNLGKFL